MNVLIYADVNLNLIDGSTIWVESLAEILVKHVGAQVTVLSREPNLGTGVMASLSKIDGLSIMSCDRFEEVMQEFPRPGDPWGIEKIISIMDEENHFDKFIVRSSDVARVIARVTALKTRLWAYLIDNPPFNDEAAQLRIGEIAADAGGIFVQTDAQRAILEAIHSEAAGKTSVLPPMVRPPSGMKKTDDAPAARGGPLRLVYSGKYSITWNVEAFFELPQLCKQAGVDATVTMIGDKVHAEAADPAFRDRILKKLKGTEGVEWLGALSREEAMRQSADCDLGLCWRTDALNDSLEISTKFLEFSASGVPSIVNRTAAYEALLGADYPFFAANSEDAVAACKAAFDPAVYDLAQQRCLALARDYSYDRAAERLRRALKADISRARLAAPERRRILIASHDLKFLDAALADLNLMGKYDLRYDHWESTTTHDEQQSQALLADADAIFCEWCTGQAVWYARNKKPNQKLYIRLHRFEANTNFPGEIEPDTINGVIVVSEHFRELCADRFRWPKNKITVLPQYCLADQFDRRKYPGAETTLGFVGINGFHHKRFDRAVDILRKVRAKAPEFRMRVRSAMPWEFGWIWKDNAPERAKFEALFQSIEDDRDLREAIIFDRPGRNMPEWFRRIGYILSTSESEGCHTSIAEGICGGTEPIVIDWPGAASVYGEEAVHGSVDAMADAILATHSRGHRAERSQTLRAEGRSAFDVARTVGLLDEMLSA